MGGHGHEPYKVPHPSIYKVESSWQLKEVKEALGRQGLSDPWARNEVWRYNFSTHAQRARIFFTRGFLLGLGLTIATVAAETALGVGGGHHDEHHGEEHHGDEHH